MTSEIKEALARSLTADTTELLPFLPYLLQDFWELGSDPEVMIRLIKNHVTLSPQTRVLDLACGKKAIFEGYVRSQQNEYDDIESTIICVTWMLRKA